MSGDYAVLNDVNQLHSLATKLLEEGKPVGFDVETGYSGPDAAKRSTDHWHPDQFTVGFSLTNSPDWARYVPLRHDDAANVSDVKAAWDAVSELLTKGHIVAHNAKFEMHSVKKSANIDLAAEGTLDDTMLDAYVLSEWAHANYRGMVGLKDLVLEILGHQMTKITELFPDKPKNWYSKLRFNILDLSPIVVAYACEDASWVLALSNAISARATRERKDMRSIEHRIAFIMADVERYGVSLDWEGMKTAYAQAQTFVPNMEIAVKKGLGPLAGGRDLSDLNLGSPQQMKKLLYQDIGLATTRQTKSAQNSDDKEEWEKMSTDAKALKTLSDDLPAVKKLLELREVQNLNKRLKKWLTEFSSCYDGKIHPNYNQVQVGTGRFAANDPPIQQCPKEWRWTTALGYDPFNKDQEQSIWEPIKERYENGTKYWTGNFRDFIIASPGTYLLTYDYSQIELRVLAGESQEPALLSAFASGTDIHSVTAAQMLGKRVEDLNPKTERPIGKTMNFALLYGMGPKSLAEQLGVSFEKAKELYRQYFSVFSKINSWMEKTQEIGVKRGYAETRFGRRYRVWELDADQNTPSGKAIAAKGRRVLINAPIQGAAADYMKMAMIRVYNELVRRGWWGTKCTIIMNQHDSLTFECSNDLDPNEVKKILEKSVVFGPDEVPKTEGFPKIIADWELGQRWGSSTAWKGGMEAVFDGEHWQLVKEGEQLPTVEQDKDDFDPENDSLPKISEEILEAALNHVETRIPDEPPLLAVELLKMPSTDRFKEFVALLAKYPGDMTVKLVTPDGELELPMKTSLSMDQQGKVSLILGGASMRLKSPQASVAGLTSGLGF
jgi:DNA polymerase-1